MGNWRSYYESAEVEKMTMAKAIDHDTQVLVRVIREGCPFETPEQYQEYRTRKAWDEAGPQPQPTDGGNGGNAGVSGLDMNRLSLYGSSYQQQQQ